MNSFFCILLFEMIICWTTFYVPQCRQVRTQKTIEQLAWEEEDRTFLLEIKWPVAIGLHGLHGGHQR